MEQSQVGKTITDLDAHIVLLQQKINGSGIESGFDTEFNHIERVSDRELCNANVNELFASALLPVNRNKNRYSNVLPPESTRVVLEVIDGVEGSDYINASFISGEIEGTQKAYVAKQGPLPNTFQDFWRMVWEQKSVVIVMLTKELENLRIKCNRYWPEDGEPSQFGDITVTLLEMNTTPDLLTRKFEIQYLSEEPRIISHYQYVAWPDHGLPVSTTAFLDLIKAVDEDNGPEKPPIIVHCSAGIGRSGTFCAVHGTLERHKKLIIEDPNAAVEFNIVRSVLRMRNQRPGMVQTKEQYMFCYLAIQEGISRNIQENNS